MTIDEAVSKGLISPSESIELKKYVNEYHEFRYEEEYKKTLDKNKILEDENTKLKEENTELKNELEKYKKESEKITETLMEIIKKSSKALKILIEQEGKVNDMGIL